MIDMMKATTTNKRHLRNDIILIVLLLLLAAVGGIYLFLFRDPGNMVTVTVNGEAYGTYSLSKDRVENIYTGKDGQQLNRLVIRGGKVFVETATCPDGICSDHRAIFRDGESIVCLPHRVVITVGNRETSDA